MKKLLNVLMYLSMLLVVLSISVSANSGTLIEKIEITTTYPIIGTSTKIGSSDIKISDPDVIIVDARWEDQHGSYVENLKQINFISATCALKPKADRVSI